MPALIGLYIRQILIGFGLSAAFVGTLLWFDVARLWSLVSGSDIGLLAAFLLWLFNGIVFAGVQFGIAIMRMSGDDTGSGGKRDRLPTPLVPAPAEAPAAPRKGPLRMLRRQG